VCVFEFFLITRTSLFVIEFVISSMYFCLLFGCGLVNDGKCFCSLWLPIGLEGYCLGLSLNQEHQCLGLDLGGLALTDLGSLVFRYCFQSLDIGLEGYCLGLHQFVSV